MSNEPITEEDDGRIRCWCGAVGTYDELFSDDTLEKTCGGSGVLTCECGGGFCVCHHHGETECDGCFECETEEDDFRCDNYFDEEADQ